MQTHHGLKKGIPFAFVCGRELEAPIFVARHDFRTAVQTSSSLQRNACACVCGDKLGGLLVISRPCSAWSQAVPTRSCSQRECPRMWCLVFQSRGPSFFLIFHGRRLSLQRLMVLRTSFLGCSPKLEAAYVIARDDLRPSAQRLRCRKGLRSQAVNADP